jgi:hypothetical protein
MEDQADDVSAEVAAGPDGAMACARGREKRRSMRQPSQIMPRTCQAAIRRRQSE